MRLRRQLSECSSSLLQETWDRRESTSSTLFLTAALVRRVATGGRTSPTWILTQSLRTTGSSPNNRGTIGPKNWTAARGSRTGENQNLAPCYVLHNFQCHDLVFCWV